MAEHRITAEVRFSVELQSGHPDDWETTDITGTGEWVCSCGSSFNNAEAAAKHYREVRDDG
jgi:hypothetical protein